MLGGGGARLLCYNVCSHVEPCAVLPCCSLLAHLIARRNEERAQWKRMQRDGARLQPNSWLTGTVVAWCVSPYRMIVFWMAGVWHTFYLEKEPEARFECSLCKFPCFFSAVGCSCNPTTVSCLHHYNKVVPNNHATCPPSALMLKHAHTTHPHSDVLVQALLQVSGELAQD